MFFKHAPSKLIGVSNPETSEFIDVVLNEGQTLIEWATENLSSNGIIFPLYSDPSILGSRDVYQIFRNSSQFGVIILCLKPSDVVESEILQDDLYVIYPATLG